MSFFYDQDLEFSAVGPGAKRKIRAYGGRLMMVEFFFEDREQAQVTPHAHRHEQVTYCLEGELELILGDETRLMKAGDSAYIPPNVPHGAVPKSEKARALDIFTPIREDFLK